MSLRNGISEDERGFVLSGIALLLILPAMLLTSTFLVTVHEGNEAISIQTVSDKVFYTGVNIENAITQMKNHGMEPSEENFNVIEEKFESLTSLTVEIENTNGNVSIYVSDPNKTAEFSSEITLDRANEEEEEEEEED